MVRRDIAYSRRSRGGGKLSMLTVSCRRRSMQQQAIGLARNGGLAARRLPALAREPGSEQLVGLRGTEFATVDRRDHDVAADAARCEQRRCVAFEREPGPGDADLHGRADIEPVAIAGAERRHIACEEVRAQIVVAHGHALREAEPAKSPESQTDIAVVGITETLVLRQPQMGSDHENILEQRPCNALSGLPKTRQLSTVTIRRSEAARRRIPRTAPNVYSDDIPRFRPRRGFSAGVLHARRTYRNRPVLLPVDAPAAAVARAGLRRVARAVAQARRALRPRRHRRRARNRGRR